MQRYRDAIASIESAGSGDYGAVGPTNQRLGRALGRYQIMEANIGPWSREALGREVSPEEFLANPQLQDAIFDHKFGGYVDQYGPEGAAQAWFAGPGGVGKMGRKDVLGTSVADYTRKFSGAVGREPAQANAPRGILSTMNTEPEATPMQDEKPRGLLGRLFGMDADRADQLRLNINGLLHNPNEGLQRGVEARMGERSDGRKEAKAQASAQQQANRTAQWLAQQPGGQQYAQAIASGALPAGEALTMWRQQSQGPTKGTEINGQLVNPTTGEVMGDYRDQGGSETEADRELARLESIGMTREEAIRMKEGVIKVIADPVTGQARLVDLQNNTSRILGDQQGTQAPESAPQPQPTTQPEIGNVRGALGGRGVANSIANTVMDAVGGGLPAREAEQAASNLTSLSTQTMLALSGEWSGRPSNLTRERIEALTVKPNELFTGPDKALIRFKEMSQLIGQALISADEVANGNYTPAQRTEAAQKKQMLAPLLQEYNAIVQQLEGGTGSGTGRTSSGVQWSVEP